MIEHIDSILAKREKITRLNNILSKILTKAESALYYGGKVEELEAVIKEIQKLTLQAES